MLINLTKLPADILSAALDYWVNIKTSDLVVVPFPGELGNRIIQDHDISDEVGLKSKGMDFRLTECRSCMKLIHPNNPIIVNYISLFKDNFNIVNYSGCHYMDVNGFIQWHTNQHERPGFNYRLYVTFNEKSGSVFKYILPGTNEVITFAEPTGWYAKLFSIEDEFLHCVKANGPRYSFGLFF